MTSIKDVAKSVGVSTATRLPGPARSEPRPTTVFATSDEMAVGAVHAVREAGLRVPEDVSIMGIDDHEMAESFDLSTVAQPVHEQGRRAAQLLIDLMTSDPGNPGEPSAVTIPTRLVVRGTTGPPAS